MLKIAWAPCYAHPLPENHRFPMEKYDLLPEQLLYEGTITPENLFEPSTLKESVITAVHESTYWKKLKNLNLSKSEERRTGFPLSMALVERETTISSGTLQASRYALEHGVGMNIAGGTHHAFTYKGEGFCLLNDIAISAHDLLGHQLVEKILVIDLDVHQGDGTAQIFQNDKRVYTFSMHGKSNYPLHKEQSDLDIGLEDGTNDILYLSLLDRYLNILFEEVKPDFIFYQSGVDVLKSDKLGKLSLTIQGCKERDRKVLQTCKTHKVPVSISMGGGYSENIAHIIEAHANTFRMAQDIFF